MKKTCMNCVYYYSCLGDPSSEFHIHDYCSAWKQEIGMRYKSELNKTLEDLSYGTNYFPIYDDIETGDAYCYMFQSKNPVTDDSVFENNKNENKKVLLKCINNYLEEMESFTPDEADLTFKETLLKLKDKYNI